MRTKYPIDPKEVSRGSQAFRANERRDAMYKVATFLVEHFWGKASEMADALGVLLLTWNNALYRYGSFDFSALEDVLRENLNTLTACRGRSILSFTDSDEEPVRALFNSFLDALKIADGKSKGTRSPVAVAKALHLLAPEFFPLWDDQIARGYHCHYSRNPSAKYLAFIRISKQMAEEIVDSVHTDGVSLLKMIDEYNYAKFTKKWI